MFPARRYLSFGGSGVTGGSLPDGLYTLIIQATGARDVAGNPLAGYTPVKFHRLFGDTDGDRDVDAADLAQFRRALNRQNNYRADLDYDADQLIDLTDYGQFKLRVNRRVL